MVAVMPAWRLAWQQQRSQGKTWASKAGAGKRDFRELFSGNDHIRIISIIAVSFPRLLHRCLFTGRSWTSGFNI
jgi:hypothetical protein